MHTTVATPRTTKRDNFRVCDESRRSIEKFGGAAGVDIEAACKFVKENMDRKFGPTFHCVMGEGFSFEVTR